MGLKKILASTALAAALSPLAIAGTPHLQPSTLTVYNVQTEKVVRSHKLTSGGTITEKLGCNEVAAIDFNKKGFSELKYALPSKYNSEHVRKIGSDAVFTADELSSPQALKYTVLGFNDGHLQRSYNFKLNLSADACEAPQDISVKNTANIYLLDEVQKAKTRRVEPMESAAEAQRREAARERSRENATIRDMHVGKPYHQAGIALGNYTNSITAALDGEPVLQNTFSGPRFTFNYGYFGQDTLVKVRGVYQSGNEGGSSFGPNSNWHIWGGTDPRVERQQGGSFNITFDRNLIKTAYEKKIKDKQGNLLRTEARTRKVVPFAGFGFEARTESTGNGFTGENFRQWNTYLEPRVGVLIGKNGYTDSFMQLGVAGTLQQIMQKEQSFMFGRVYDAQNRWEITPNAFVNGRFFLDKEGTWKGFIDIDGRLGPKNTTLYRGINGAELRKDSRFANGAVQYNLAYKNIVFSVRGNVATSKDNYRLAYNPIDSMQPTGGSVFRTDNNGKALTFGISYTWGKDKQ
jgi:hypothetical protein